MLLLLEGWGCPTALRFGVSRGTERGPLNPWSLSAQFRFKDQDFFWIRSQAATRRPKPAQAQEKGQEGWPLPRGRQRCGLGGR